MKTIEEKAHRYDEAIEIAKEINNEQRAQPFNIMTKVFPELAESKDERIRKTLIKHFEEKLQNGYEWAGIPVNSILAWLEKQGEHYNFRQKIQVGDQVTRNEDGVLVNLSQLKRVAKQGDKQGEQKSIEAITKEVVKDKDSAISFLRSAGIMDEKGNLAEPYRIEKQKPVEWSEEDEAMIMTIINRLELGKTNTQEIPYIDKCISWLKSLRPQKQWKPSEYEIQLLKDVTSGVNRL